MVPRRRGTCFTRLIGKGGRIRGRFEVVSNPTPLSRKVLPHRNLKEHHAKTVIVVSPRNLGMLRFLAKPFGGEIKDVDAIRQCRSPMWPRPPSECHHSQRGKAVRYHSPWRCTSLMLRNWRRGGQLWLENDDIFRPDVLVHKSGSMDVKHCRRDGLR